MGKPVMINYLDMFLQGAQLLLNRDGSYHLLHRGDKFSLSLTDALRITRHPLAKKKRRNIWVRRTARYRQSRLY